MTDSPGSDHLTPPPAKSGIGVVVIGRNEGKRLIRCLASIDREYPIVYVDSGSDDGSPDLARAAGVDVISLDPSQPFTAARARNTGLDHLAKTFDRLEYVQMIDGDCKMAPRWLATAIATMDVNTALGAVFGRRRERFADRSVYNWLCDIEWAIPRGRSKAFGGDVLLRRRAVEAAGGYSDDMIAGEDPDLSIRMRQLGWQILCIDNAMTVHDAAIYRFGPWWHRAVRAGHAFAELVDRHPGKRWHDYRRNYRRILFWGGLVPLAALAGFAFGLITGERRGFGIFLGAALLTLAQAVRIAVREQRRHPARQAIKLAIFLTLGKYAELTGMIRYHVNRLRRRRTMLIEYKDRGTR